MKSAFIMKPYFLAPALPRRPGHHRDAAAPLLSNNRIKQSPPRSRLTAGWPGRRGRSPALGGSSKNTLVGHINSNKLESDDERVSQSYLFSRSLLRAPYFCQKDKATASSIVGGPSPCSGEALVTQVIITGVVWSNGSKAQLICELREFATSAAAAAAKSLP